MSVSHSNYVRCKKCRTSLFSWNDFPLVNSHSSLLYATSEEDLHLCDLANSCKSLQENNCLFLKEEPYPSFILEALNKASWSKGKLHCCKCKARVGSFNLINAFYCSCNKHILPSVHLLTTKVDFLFPTHQSKAESSQLQDGSIDLCVAPVVRLSEPPTDMTESMNESSNLHIDTYSSDRQINSSLPCCSSQDYFLSDFSTGTADCREVSAHTDSPGVPLEVDCELRRRNCKREKEPVSAISSSPSLINCEYSNSKECECQEDDPPHNSDIIKSEATSDKIPDHLICPVCLDLLFSPFVVKPCSHIFCEPCLRRLAKPSPTNTSCPLCRELIGICNPCTDLLKEIKATFSNQYEERHKFERQHNSQHLPLPWLRNYRFFGLRGIRGVHYGPHWTGWRTVLWIFLLDVIGLGLVLCIKWILGDFNLEHLEMQNRQKSLNTPNVLDVGSSYVKSQELIDISNETFLDNIVQ